MDIRNVFYNNSNPWQWLCFSFFKNSLAVVFSFLNQLTSNDLNALFVSFCKLLHLFKKGASSARYIAVKEDKGLLLSVTTHKNYLKLQNQCGLAEQAR